jgi:hypothetical protein
MMNGKILLTGLLVFWAILSFSQSNPHLKLGLGYFSETVAYPGFVLEFEREKMQSEKLSLPQRANLGFYNHPRNHMGLFFDIHQGTRRYFKKGLFLESAVGIGVLFPFYNEDVWEVDESGAVTEGSKFGGVDFMPSMTFGIGYCLNKEKNNLIAFRPKLFWQYPHNQKALPHTAFQLIYTHTL